MKLTKQLWTGMCLAVMLCLPAKELLAQPFPSCEDLELVAKFELNGKSYKFEKPKGNEDLVSVDGDDQSATWSADGATIEKIIVFGGGDYKIEDVNGTGGTISNTGLQNRGGQTPGISNIQFCGVKTPPPPPDNGIDCPCEGKATYLLLEYQGTETVEISVRMRRGPSTDLVNIGTVNPGETFEVFGLPGPNPGFDGTLGTDIFIMYNEEEQQIHTSCSQPLFVGQVHGLFEVIAFASKQGGLCPPIDECPEDATPPTATYKVIEIEQNEVYHVKITITDEEGLQSIAPTLKSFEFNFNQLKYEEVQTQLTLLNPEALDFAAGTKEVVLELSIDNLEIEHSVELAILDICGLNCPDMDVPRIGLRSSQLTIFDQRVWANQALVGASNAEIPGIENDGIWYFQLFNFFNLDAKNVQTLGDAIVGDPFVGIHLGPNPPPVIDYDLKKIDSQIVSTHGALAANRCNAWIVDPPIAVLQAQINAGRNDGISVAAQLERPQEISLGENYPNPFNPATRIDFALPEAATVSLIVYDVLGRQVAVLVDGYREAGQHNVLFDASHLTSGTYFYQLSAAETSITRRMVLMK